jgi:hypothetical protein
MICGLRTRPGIATKVMRDGAGDEPDQPYPEATSYFRLEPSPVGRRQVVGGLAAAVGDHLGQTAELVVAQVGGGVVGSGSLAGLGESFAGHALVLDSWEARAGREPHPAVRSIGIRAPVVRERKG